MTAPRLWHVGIHQIRRPVGQPNASAAHGPARAATSQHHTSKPHCVIPTICQTSHCTHTSELALNPPNTQSCHIIDAHMPQFLTNQKNAACAQKRPAKTWLGSLRRVTALTLIACLEVPQPHRLLFLVTAPAAFLELKDCALFFFSSAFCALLICAAPSPIRHRRCHLQAHSKATPHGTFIRLTVLQAHMQW